MTNTSLHRYEIFIEALPAHAHQSILFICPMSRIIQVHIVLHTDPTARQDFIVVRMQGADVPDHTSTGLVPFVVLFGEWLQRVAV